MFKTHNDMFYKQFYLFFIYLFLFFFILFFFIFFFFLRIDKADYGASLTLSFAETSETMSFCTILTSSNTWLV